MARQTFLVSLGYPMGKVFGRPGLVVGVFLASGLYHRWISSYPSSCIFWPSALRTSFAMYGDGVTEIDWINIGFFAGQSVALFGESLYRKVTGRRVGGKWGLLWTWLWIITTAHPICESVWIYWALLRCSWALDSRWSMATKRIDRNSPHSYSN